jgi:hypothetical protein
LEIYVNGTFAAGQLHNGQSDLDPTSTGAFSIPWYLLNLIFIAAIISLLIDTVLRSQLGS